MIIGKTNFDQNKTYVMGILNVTPDSFSDGGRFNTVDSARKQALKMIAEGAHVIDIGGESTRPGFTQISEEEEIERVCPIIEMLRKETDIPISLDTYKSKVAVAGIECGANLINDIWGLRYDPAMAHIIAESGTSCVLMHNRNDSDYNNLINDIFNDMQESIDIALKAGIPKDRIMLDPGIGFAKSYEDNLTVLNHLKDFNTLGYPVLLGASRKSVIGLTLDLPKDERLEGTIATSVWAVMCGCNFVRVHDVAANLKAIRMAEAIKNARG